MANDERENQGGDEGGRGAGGEHRGHGGGHGKGGGGHGGGHEEPHEGAPEWLISFADNVTLMMGFFVILLALNMKPAETGGGSGDGHGGGGADNVSPAMLDWTIGVRAAFNNPVDIKSTDPRDQLLVQRLMVREGRGRAAEPGPKGKNEDTQTIRPSDYVGIGGVVSFAVGGNELTPEALASAQEIAKHLRGFRSIVEVRGHVSSAEAHDFPNGGTALSYQRAATVAEVLTSEGVDWKRIRLVACGAGEPVTTPAYDDASQRSNQRVEVIVTDRTLPDEGVPTTSEAPPDRAEK